MFWNVRKKIPILLSKVSFEVSGTGTFYWEKNNLQIDLKIDLEDHDLILILKITIFGDLILKIIKVGDLAHFLPTTDKDENTSKITDKYFQQQLLTRMTTLAR